MGAPSAEVFTEFVRQAEPRLRYALVAHLGASRGRDAVEDALVWAWEHWDRVVALHNPYGYLYRVAKRRAFRQRLPARVGPEQTYFEAPSVEPGLPAAFRTLSSRQRVVVFLVEGLGMTHQEVADYLHISRSAVQTHLERALRRLRAELGVADAV